MQTKRLFLAIALFAPACGGDSNPTTLAFRAERDLLGEFEQDTGFVPQGAPTGIRVVASASAELVVDARAVVSGSDLTPVEGSGSLSMAAAFSLEVSARVDAAGVEYEGVVETFEYAIDPEMVTFEPFALDETVGLSRPLPPAELAKVPLPSVPGASLVVDIAGGSLDIAYSGVCATVANGLAQYTASAVIDGTLELEGSIEIDVPILGTETFGPFAVEVPIPAMTTDLDLGTFSASSGAPVEGSPCDALLDDTDGPAGTSGGAMTTASEGGSTGSDPGDDSMSTGDGSGDSADTDSTDGPTDPAPECRDSVDCALAEECVDEACVPVPASCSNASDCTACPGSQSCSQCVQHPNNVCGPELVACQNDSVCVSIVQCVNFCDDELCNEACRQGRPLTSLDLFDAALACISGACPG